MNTEISTPSAVPKRYVLIGAVILIVALTALAGWWLLRPGYAVLERNGNDANTAEMLALLMQWQVPYQLDAATGDILVPEEQLTALRARLSGMGVMQRGKDGFELFAQGDYGVSEFTQKVNFQRALEGELSRTIRSFTEVREARVHLSMGKGSLFENRREPAKASVVLHLHEGQRVDARQVAGVQQLVAGAVAGLETKHVVVIDEQGHPLSDDERNPASANRLDMARQFETELEAKALRLLDALPNMAGARVSVRAQFDFDRVKTVREELLPSAVTGQGHMSRKRDSQTQGGGDGANAEGKKVLSSSAQNEQEFLFGRMQSEIERAVGSVKGISVGVVAPRAVSESEVESMRALLTSGLGLELAKGDRLAVVGGQQHKQSVLEVERTDAALSLTSARAADEASLSWLWPVVGAATLLLLAAVFWFARQRGAQPRALTLAEREALLSEVKAWLQQHGK